MNHLATSYPRRRYRPRTYALADNDGRETGKCPLSASPSSLGGVALGLALLLLTASTARTATNSLDDQLATVLKQAGFTGRVESTLESRLGRRIDPKLADLGRLLFFDKLHAL